MSKRFGRNQRRRAREQVAKLQNENGLLTVGADLMEASLRKAANEVHMLRRELSDAKLYLGENSPAFPPNQFDFGRKLYRDEPFSLPTRTGWNEAIAMQVVRRDSEDLRDQVHFLLFAGPEQWGYAITKRALASAPREVIAQHIVAVLVDMMLDKMNTRGRR